MGSPTRWTAGFTQDAKFQPLGLIGQPDPFFYATFSDDFTHYNAGDYTVTAASGSVAQTAGSGGLLLFTTGATATNFAEIQVKAASFPFTTGKKLAYLTRIQASEATNSAIIAGLIETVVTPFSAVTDGIYFYKASAGTSIVVNVVSGSTTIGTTTLTNVLAANTNIDLGFVVDANGDILIYAGSNLIGQGNQDSQTTGPTARIAASSLSAAMPTANLNPTLAIQTSAAAAITMTADFMYGALER